MKIKEMTKQQLIKNIEIAEKKIKSAQWVKNHSKFWLGVMIVHQAKLRAELTRREKNEK